MQYLKDKVAIVTGGAKGMGEAICKKFADEGATLVVNDIDYKGAQNVAGEIVEKGGTAIANKVDVTKRDEVIAVVGDVAKQFGRIDILINNVGGIPGMQGRGNSETIEMEEWDRIINLNLNGTLHYLLAVIPFMKKVKSGKIINFSSIGCFYPTVSVLPYHAAKGGVESLTLNLAFELAPSNINVNLIVPGPVRTAFWDNIVYPEGMTHDDMCKIIAEKEVPLKRVGTPEDVAGVALFLASGLSDFVTGQRIYVSGGMPHILPQTGTASGL